MEKLDSALCIWTVLYTNYFNFQCIHTFYKPNNIKTKPSANVISCYTIALKCWDEFNADFVLLYFSSYS